MNYVFLDNPSAVFARRRAVFFGIPDRNDEAASGVPVLGRQYRGYVRA